MAKIVNFTIDGKDCIAEEGLYLCRPPKTTGIHSYPL
jgi:hypothetical protein